MGNLDIISLISPSDIISISEFTLILYNYSLLLRSIQVFMDLKNDIHRGI